MSKLIIVDIQESYRKFCHEIIAKIDKFAETFDEVVLVLDNTDSDYESELIVEEYYDENSIINQKNATIVKKQYGFFRNLMDVGIDDELIVKFIKFMIKNDIHDSRDILENDVVLKKYKKDFGKTDLINLDFNNYYVNLPAQELIEFVESLNQTVVICGGGRSECLKEICLLLDVFNKEYSVEESLTY